MPPAEKASPTTTAAANVIQQMTIKRPPVLAYAANKPTPVTGMVPGGGSSSARGTAYLPGGGGAPPNSARNVSKTKKVFQRYVAFTAKLRATFRRQSNIGGGASKLLSPHERVAIEKKKHAQAFLMEAIKYVIFLAVFAYVTFAIRPSYGYEMSSMVQRSIVGTNFTLIKNVDDFWYWLEHTALPPLFPELDIAGNPLSESQQKFVMNSNRLLGLVRIRQVRTPWGWDCQPDPKFLNPKLVMQCISDHFSSPEGELMDPILVPQLKLVSSLNSTHARYETQWVPKWKWQSGPELCAQGNDVTKQYCRTLTVGATDVLYPPSGYVVDVPPQQYFTDLAAWKANCTNTTTSSQDSSSINDTDADSSEALCQALYAAPLNFSAISNTTTAAAAAGTETSSPSNCVSVIHCFNCTSTPYLVVSNGLNKTYSNHFCHVCNVTTNCSLSQNITTDADAAALTVAPTTATANQFLFCGRCAYTRAGNQTRTTTNVTLTLGNNVNYTAHNCGQCVPSPCFNGTIPPEVVPSPCLSFNCSDWGMALKPNGLLPMACTSSGEGCTAQECCETPHSCAQPIRWNYVTQAINEMKALGFLDKETVFVSVEFTVYNANVRIMTAVRVMFEFFPSGNVLPRFSIRPVSLLGFETVGDVVVFCAEVVLALLVGVYMYDKGLEIFRYFAVKSVDCIVCDIKKIRRLGLAPVVVCRVCMRDFNPFDIEYCPDCQQDTPKRHRCWRGFFQELWNFLDIWNFITFAVVIAFRFRLRNDLNRMSIATDSLFINFYPLAWQITITNALDAFNMLLCFVKSLKYLGKIRGMHVLIRTLEYSFTEIVFFLITWFVFYAGFSLAFLLAFGVSDFEYRTWDTSLVSLFMTMLGQFNYDLMNRANRICAPLLLATFLVWMAMISVNLFIAILDSNYVKATNEAATATYDFLNSSLALLMKSWRDRLSFIFGKNKRLDQQGFLLLSKMDRIPGLSKSQKKELVLFRKQMTDTPDVKLISALLKTFPDYNERNFAYDDFITMQKLVKKYKTAQKAAEEKMKMGVWEGLASSSGGAGGGGGGPGSQTDRDRLKTSARNKGGKKETMMMMQQQLEQSRSRGRTLKGLGGTKSKEELLLTSRGRGGNASARDAEEKTSARHHTEKMMLVEDQLREAEQLLGDLLPRLQQQRGGLSTALLFSDVSDPEGSFQTGGGGGGVAGPPAKSPRSGRLRSNPENYHFPKSPSGTNLGASLASSSGGLQQLQQQQQQQAGGSDLGSSTHSAGPLTMAVANGGASPSGGLGTPRSPTSALKGSSRRPRSSSGPFSSTMGGGAGAELAVPSSSATTAQPEIVMTTMDSPIIAVQEVGDTPPLRPQAIIDAPNGRHSMQKSGRRGSAGGDESFPSISIRPPSFTGGIAADLAKGGDQRRPVSPSSMPGSVQNSPLIQPFASPTLTMATPKTAPARPMAGTGGGGGSVSSRAPPTMSLDGMVGANSNNNNEQPPSAYPPILTFRPPFLPYGGGPIRPGIPFSPPSPFFGGPPGMIPAPGSPPPYVQWPPRGPGMTMMTNRSHIAESPPKAQPVDQDDEDDQDQAQAQNQADALAQPQQLIHQLPRHPPPQPPQQQQQPASSFPKPALSSRVTGAEGNNGGGGGGTGGNLGVVQNMGAPTARSTVGGGVGGPLPGAMYPPPRMAFPHRGPPPPPGMMMAMPHPGVRGGGGGPPMMMMRGPGGPPPPQMMWMMRGAAPPPQRGPGMGQQPQHMAMPMNFVQPSVRQVSPPAAGGGGGGGSKN